MSYLSSIKTALIAFPLIAIIITIPFVLLVYHRYGSINKYRVLIIYSFVLYLMTIYFLVILPLPEIEYVAKLTTRKVQLIPFNFILDFIKDSPFRINDPSTYLSALKDASFYTVFFNIVMITPFGMYLRYYYKCSLKRVILYSFLLSLFFELTQLSGLYFIYPRPYRLFDVDDLIMNTFGGVCGYWLMGLFENILPTREDIDEKSLIKGQIVTALRRITLALLDLSICGLISLLIQMFIKYSYVNYVVILIYYVIIPYFNNYQTLGGKFLKVKFSFKHNNILSLMIKEVATILYWQLPFIVISIAKQVMHLLSLEQALINSVYFALLMFMLLFYLVSIVSLLKNRFMIYDNISKVKFESTIKS